MKTTILTFVLILFAPLLAQSQTGKNSFSLRAGGEYQDSEHHGWNTELHFNRQINTSKFYTEFGLNYSIVEYNRANKFQLSAGCGHPNIALGTIPCPINGYYFNSVVEYQKEQVFRLQAGINYRIIEKPKFVLSGGVNFNNQIAGKTTRHGQQILYPADCYDTLPVIRGTFAFDHKASKQLSMLLQSHVDVAFQLSEKLYFESRLSYYGQVLPRIRHGAILLTIGFSYRW